MTKITATAIQKYGLLTNSFIASATAFINCFKALAKAFITFATNFATRFATFITCFFTCLFTKELIDLFNKTFDNAFNRIISENEGLKYHDSLYFCFYLIQNS